MKIHNLNKVVKLNYNSVNKRKKNCTVFMFGAYNILIPKRKNGKAIKCRMQETMSKTLIEFTPKPEKAKKFRTIIKDCRVIYESIAYAGNRQYFEQLRIPFKNGKD